MRQRRWLCLLCFWPGLPQLCAANEWRGFGLALWAAFLLNAAIVTGWVWTEVIPRQGRIVLWIGVACVWLGAGGRTLWWAWRSGGERRRKELDELYRQAVNYYLKRRWSDVERCLRQIVGRDPHDCDALVQLATVYRRLGRGAEARRILRRCQRLDSAKKWRWEIGDELRRVSRNRVSDALTSQ